METVQVEVWVLINEDGDYVVGKDREALKEAYEGDIGELDTIAYRLVKATLNVPKPRPVELVATIAEEPTCGELKAL